MVLESTVVCIDNGEFMRNGDFVPNRMQAQQDAANLVIQCKLRSNPENCVALLTMAPRVDLLVALTQDNGKLMTKLHQVQPKGFCNFLNAIRVAQLALKHRQNRNHKTRVVVFVGSPLTENQDELVQIAKKLKKEKIQVDVVCFGEDLANCEKLKGFVETLNGKDTGSHLVVVPGGSSLQEALLQSAILRGEDGNAPAVSIGQGGGFDFGIDPNEDPELAMALRVSLEEQRQRQEQEARHDVQATPAGATAASSAVAGGTSTPVATTAASASAGPAASSKAPARAANLEAMTEDEQLAYALEISVANDEKQSGVEPMDTGDKGSENSDDSDEVNNIMGDPAALEALVSSLPGVDPKSDVVRKAVADAQQASGKAKPKPDDKGGSSGGGSTSGEQKKK